MKITIKGDFKTGRESMKLERRRLTSEIRKLERKHEKLRVMPSNKELNQLRSLQKKVPIFSVSLTIPVKYEGIVINGKLLQAFNRKLRGMYRQITADEKKLVLHYGHRPKEWIGELELYDLSHYFKGFTDIPKLVIKDG